MSRKTQNTRKEAYTPTNEAGSYDPTTTTNSGNTFTKPTGKEFQETSRKEQNLTPEELAERDRARNAEANDKLYQRADEAGDSVTYNPNEVDADRTPTPTPSQSPENPEEDNDEGTGDEGNNEDTAEKK